RPDQIRARAYVGYAVAGLVDPGAVESDAVVPDAVVAGFDHQIGRVFGAHFHIHMPRPGVPADVVERLLNHSVKLNPFDVRKPQAVFQDRLAVEFVGEFLFGGQLRHGVAQGPFERGQESDGVERRRAEVFTDVTDLAGDRFDLAAEGGGRRRRIIRRR